MLRGRATEIGRLDDLVAAARAGHGVYSQYVATGVMAFWIVGVTRVLLARRPSTTSAVDRVAVAAR